MSKTKKNKEGGNDINTTDSKNSKRSLSMDLILKNIFTISDARIIEMINSMFGKELDTDSKVMLKDKELHYFDTKREINQIRADMILLISDSDEIQDIIENEYHLEFETRYNQQMALRMAQYGFLISRGSTNAVLFDETGITVKMPKQIVIFIEETDKLKNDYILLKTVDDDGQKTERRIRVLRYWQETPETLHEKKLEPLLPLQVFRLRKDLLALSRLKLPETEKERKIEAKLSEVKEILCRVAERMNEMYENGELTEADVNTLETSAFHLSEYLYSTYSGYAKIEKEAHEMVESVFTPSKWKQEGMQKGIEKGIEKGKLEGNRETAREMFLDNEKIEKIRKYSKLSDEELLKVLNGLPQETQDSYKKYFTV